MTDDHARDRGHGDAGGGRPTARARRKPAARRAPAKREPAAEPPPAADEPAAKRPAAKKKSPPKKRPAAKRPAAKKKTATKKKPAAKKKPSAAEEPAAKRPAAKKKTATEKKPAAKRPAAKKKTATEKKPAAKKRTKPEPSVRPPGVFVDAEELETVAEVPVPRVDGSDRSVRDKLQDLEKNLDSLLSDAGGSEADPMARRRAAAALGEIAARLAPDEYRDNPEETLFGTARELLSTDYYFRQWGRVAMRNRSEEVDDFGLDPAYDARVRPLFRFLYEKWFRAQVEGIDRVPVEGRALIVANHSGTVPWDGIMLKMAVELDHPRDELRWLAEDFVFHMPFLGAFMNRIGAVRACQENAERLLAKEKLVAVFPEGIKGIGKLFNKRYQLQRFGRGGYIKLALRTGTPIVPCAIVGAEETNPMLFKVTNLTRALGLPYVPVTPTFPWLGPLGLVPAPTRWRIVFGEPIELSEHGPEAAEDAVLVGRLNERVRGTIQQMLDSALARRSGLFF